jgi:hypothetical protein
MIYYSQGLRRSRPPGLAPSDGSRSHRRSGSWRTPMGPTHATQRPTSALSSPEAFSAARLSCFSSSTPDRWWPRPCASTRKSPGWLEKGNGVGVEGIQVLAFSVRARKENSGVVRWPRIGHVSCARPGGWEVSWPPGDAQHLPKNYWKITS